MIFGKKSKYPIGLDISDLSLKMVQLTQRRGKIKIQALSRRALPKGLIEGGEIFNEAELIHEIEKLITKPMYGTVSSNEVVACLPETKTFIKLIKIEANPNEISDIVEHEIQKHIPYSIDEVYFDWQIISKHQNESYVLVGAAPRKITDQYIRLLSNAKLSVQALEIEPVSICRCLLMDESIKYNSKSLKNYAIIDIGAKRTSIVIYCQGTIVTSVSLPISGQNTTEKIAKTLEISYEQAEKAKMVCGLDKQKAQGVIADILGDKLKDLSGHIQDAISFFNNNYPEMGAIEEIFICGGGSSIKDLDRAMTETLKIKTTRGNIFLNLDEASEKFSDILEEKHYIKNKKKTEVYCQTSIYAYATTIGLALRNIFLKDE